MKLTQKQIATIAHATKRLHPEGLGITLHFFLEENGEIDIKEDVSGTESYPGETGIPLLSTRYPLTRRAVEEIIIENEREMRCAE